MTRKTPNDRVHTKKVVSREIKRRAPEFITSARWTELFKLGDKLLKAINRETHNPRDVIATLMIAATTVAYINGLSKTELERSLNLAWRTSFGRFA